MKITGKNQRRIVAMVDTYVLIIAKIQETHGKNLIGVLVVLP